MLVHLASQIRGAGEQTRFTGIKEYDHAARGQHSDENRQASHVSKGQTE
jgi:hypothetical protein